MKIAPILSNRQSIYSLDFISQQVEFSFKYLINKIIIFITNILSYINCKFSEVYAAISRTNLQIVPIQSEAANLSEVSFLNQLQKEQEIGAEGVITLSDKDFLLVEDEGCHPQSMLEKGQKSVSRVVSHASRVILPYFTKSSDEFNLQKYECCCSQLEMIYDLEDERLLDLKALFSNPKLSKRYIYQEFVRRFAKICHEDGSSEDVQKLSVQLWNNMDMSKYYCQAVNRLLYYTDPGMQLSCFDDFVLMNAEIDKTLKESSVLGKSPLALGWQKFSGALRTMDWLSMNVPTIREEQEFSCRGDASKDLEVRYVRHANAVTRANQFESGQRAEILDPSFKQMTHALKKESKCVFYVGVSDNEEKFFENEFSGNQALYKAQDELDSFHVLFQSLDAPLLKKGEGCFCDLKKEFFEAFKTGRAGNKEYFTLPRCILDDECTLDLYMLEMQNLCESIHELLFDKQAEFTNEEFRAFCMIFFVLQRDHMKLFLKELTGLDCGHYTTVCKDFLDRGGATAFCERMVHEAMLGRFQGNKKQWLEDESRNLIGATFATKKIGVIRKRLELCRGVYELLEEKGDKIKDFPFCALGQQYGFKSVIACVRAEL